MTWIVTVVFSVDGKKKEPRVIEVDVKDKQNAIPQAKHRNPGKGYDWENATVTAKPDSTHKYRIGGASSPAYESVTEANIVAIRKGQARVSAPVNYINIGEGTAKCDKCDAEYFIGAHRELAGFQNREQLEKQLKVALGGEHAMNQQHQDEYDLS